MNEEREVALQVRLPVSIIEGLRVLANRAGMESVEAYTAGVLTAAVQSAAVSEEDEEHERQLRELEKRLRDLGYVD